MSSRRLFLKEKSCFLFWNFDIFLLLTYAVMFVLFQPQKKKVYGPQSGPSVESKFTDWLPPEGKAYVKYSYLIMNRE